MRCENSAAAGKIVLCVFCMLMCGRVVFVGFQGYPPRSDYRPEGYQGFNNGVSSSGGFNQKRGGGGSSSGAPRGGSGSMRGGGWCVV